MRAEPLPAAKLEDVADVGAFAIATVERTFGRRGSGHPLSDGERVEAQLEALVLIYELHERWEPDRYQHFSVFVRVSLPTALIDWHRTELRQSCRGGRSGRNGYHYNGRVSLDGGDEFEDGGEGKRVEPALVVHGP